jgi:hypothetical protein
MCVLYMLFTTAAACTQPACQSTLQQLLAFTPPRLVCMPDAVPNVVFWLALLRPGSLLLLHMLPPGCRQRSSAAAMHINSQDMLQVSGAPCCALFAMLVVGHQLCRHLRRSAAARQTAAPPVTWHRREEPLCQPQ